MKKIVLLLFVSLSVSLFSQKKDKVLLTIDGEETKVSEFKRVYEKNLDAIDNKDAKDINKNLDLFINYKLKVKEAYAIKLDTLPSYKREMETYKNQLSAPYLQDTTFIDKMVKDAYFRTKNEVKAKHILVRLPKNVLPKDTLEAYNKIKAIRDRIVVKGEDFEKVAVETSEDPSAKGDLAQGRKGNKGNLGYFNAFSMVYPFENAAYTTKVGAVSMPFKTQFGYHIIKVDDVRPSKGEVEAAHILIRDTTQAGKNKINSIYDKLLKKEDFGDLAKQFSEDPGSANSKGYVGKFDSRRMVKPFADAVFNLEKINDITKPFRTRFGWHIAKLLKKHPIQPFKDLRASLKSKIKRSARNNLSSQIVLDRLKAKYSIVENKESKKIINRKNIRSIPVDSLQNTLFSINEKNINQEAFIKYIRNRRHKSVYVLYDDFLNSEITTYYKDNLVNTEPEYAHTLTEYEDGLLLFELMQQKIWNKSSKDSIGLKKYYKDNITKYNSKELKTIKGEVMNDYQTFLETNWIADLRKKSTVKTNKKQLKKLINSYK